MFVVFFSHFENLIRFQKSFSVGQPLVNLRTDLNQTEFASLDLQYMLHSLNQASITILPIMSTRKVKSCITVS